MPQLKAQKPGYYSPQKLKLYCNVVSTFRCKWAASGDDTQRPQDKNTALNEKKLLQ